MPCLKIYRWGLFIIRQWDSDEVDKDRIERTPQSLFIYPPEICLVDPWVFKAMDSWALFELKNKGLRIMEHVTHKCEDPNCNHSRVVHV